MNQSRPTFGTGLSPFPWGVEQRFLIAIETHRTGGHQQGLVDASYETGQVDDPSWGIISRPSMLVGEQVPYGRLASPQPKRDAALLGLKAFVVSGGPRAATPRPGDIRQLATLRELEDGWYDDDSIAPTHSAYSVSFQVLSLIAPTAHPSPFVAPLVDGGIELSWGNRGTDRLLVRIDASGDLRLVRAVRAATGELEYGEGISGSVNEVVERLVGLRFDS